MRDAISRGIVVVELLDITHYTHSYHSLLHHLGELFVHVVLDSGHDRSTVHLLETTLNIAKISKRNAAFGFLIRHTHVHNLVLHNVVENVPTNQTTTMLLLFVNKGHLRIGRLHLVQQNTTDRREVAVDHSFLGEDNLSTSNEGISTE